MMPYRYILFTIGLIVSMVITAWVVAGQLVAPSPAIVPLPASDVPIRPFTLHSASGEQLAGWHIRSKEQKPKGVVLLFHAIRSNRMDVFARAKLLYQYGFSSIMIDFQAHGESTGKQITLGYLEHYDVLATIQYAKRLYPELPIAALGISLGGAAAILASEKIQGQLDALVVESVYSTIQTAIYNRVDRYLGFFAPLPTALLLLQLKPRLGFGAEALNMVHSIRKVSCPVLIISGEEDHHTRVDEAYRLYNNAPTPKQLWIVEGVGHQDIYEHKPKQYTLHVITFLLDTLDNNNHHSGS